MSSSRGVLSFLAPGSRNRGSATGLFAGERRKLSDVKLAAAGVQKHGSEAGGGTGVKHSRTEAHLRDLRGLWIDGDQPQIRDQFASPAEIAGDGDLAQRGTQAPQLGN